MALIERVNYDAYMKPLNEVQKVHNDTLADMANMSSQSEILDYYLDPTRDAASYNLYNNFKKEFNTNVDDFAKNGLTRNNGARLLNLHRNYNQNIANVLDAVKNRETERAEQHKLYQQSNGQVVFGAGQNADEKSVDDYLQGKKGFVFQDLDEVQKSAKNFAAAASKRNYSNNIADAVRALGNNYYHALEKEGYNNVDSYKIINNLLNQTENIIDNSYNLNDDNPEGNPADFIRNMRDELNRRGIENYSEEDRRKLIESYINGIDEGLSYKETNQFKDTPEMKSRGGVHVYNNIPNGEPPKDNMNIAWDNVTVKSDFKNDYADDQKTIYNAMISDGTNQFQNLFKKVSGGHGINTEDEYLYKKYGWQKFTRNDGSTYYSKVKGDGTKVDDKSLFNARNEYKSEINNLAKYYHLKAGTSGNYPIIEQMKNPMTKDDTAEVQLGLAMALNERHSKPHNTIGTYLQIDNEDRPKAIREAMYRNEGRKLYTNLSYNPHTGLYKFNDAEDITEDINKAQNLNSSIIRLHYLPTSDNKNENPMYVELKTEVNNGKSYFIPLDTFEAFSEAQKTLQLHNWAKERQDILVRNLNGLKQSFDLKKYGVTDVNNLDADSCSSLAKKIKEDKSMNQNDRTILLDYLAQIRESLLYIDYYRHQVIRIASKGAHTDVKAAINDLSKEPGQN